MQFNRETFSWVMGFDRVTGLLPAGAPRRAPEKTGGTAFVAPRWLQREALTCGGQL